MENDGALIKAYLDGDERSLESLFERYRRALYGYLNGIFDGDTTTADDVFQETWLRIIRALPKFMDRNNFSSWAFRIAHNQAMQNFRKKKVCDKVGALTGDGELPESSAPENTGVPDEILNAKDLGEKIEKALTKLPAEQREVFELRRQNVGFREIAAIQNCPLNTALSRMRYVVLFLRRELAELK
ncbi:MAG: sigma-70 family RNA polymerase sigma factor [Victivallaceae bacterium]|nr:sigma-70 family RNA polymerase sigma factor [Victivallaceae bacterium]